MAESMLLDAVPPETTTASSFTALLGLPSNQAMELLHDPESGQSPVIPAIKISQRDLMNYSSNCSAPVFISNTDLIERAAMFSTGTDHHQGMSNSSEDSLKLKKEDSITINADSKPTSSILDEQKQSLTKRKDREKKKKIKGSDTKKSSKKMENHQTLKAVCGKSKDDHGVEKLPYVHVRARRGQATDSHSLAERARREKINARMKLLQEIVPGCAKISGTALVLDEIINHVQSLQRQVEFLSMRLAAVNPIISFNLDGLLAAESGSVTPSIYPSTITHEPSMWPEVQVHNVVEGQQYHDQSHTQQQQHGQHQLWHLDVLQQPVWERDNNQNFVTSPENSVFSYSSANSVALPPNQLKMEI